MVLKFLLAVCIFGVIVDLSVGTDHLTSPEYLMENYRIQDIPDHQETDSTKVDKVIRLGQYSYGILAQDGTKYYPLNLNTMGEKRYHCTKLESTIVVYYQ